MFSLLFSMELFESRCPIEEPIVGTKWRNNKHNSYENSLASHVMVMMFVPKLFEFRRTTFYWKEIR